MPGFCWQLLTWFVLRHRKSLNSQGHPTCQSWWSPVWLTCYENTQWHHRSGLIQFRSHAHIWNKEPGICGYIYLWLSRISFISIGKKTIKESYLKYSRQELLYHNDCVPIVISQYMQKPGTTLQSAHNCGLITSPSVGGGSLPVAAKSFQQAITFTRSRMLKAAVEFSCLESTLIHNYQTLKNIG